MIRCGLNDPNWKEIKEKDLNNDPVLIPAYHGFVKTSSLLVKIAYKIMLVKQIPMKMFAQNDQKELKICIQLIFCLVYKVVRL